MIKHTHPNPNDVNDDDEQITLSRLQDHLIEVHGLDEMEIPQQIASEDTDLSTESYERAEAGCCNIHEVHHQQEAR